MNALAKFFSLAEKGTTVKTEVIAGITTFMTMAYILAVNPVILGAAGMDAGSVFAATAISSCIATLVMAVFAKLPVALAPGMGLNAFFTYGVVLGMGHSWQFALTAVFIEGIIFMALTVTNLREAILECFPASLKNSISAGIGLFIAFIGLQGAGYVVNSDATLVTLGSLTAPGAIVTTVGLLVTGVLLALKVRGALLIGILASTLAGIPLGVTNIASFDSAKLFTVPSLAPTFWQFDFSHILTFDMFVVLFSFLFVDMFDTIGTLVGVATKGGLMTKEGRLPRAKAALMADAVGTTLGAVLGTSTVSSYVESASGVAEGGRTGLTAVVTAFMFAIALFLSPVFLIIPAQATAPALIIVGLFMMSPIRNLDFEDYVHSIPAFLTVSGMALTYSIANGIALGMVAYVALAVLTGRAREVSLVSYCVAALFVGRFVFM